MAKVITFLKKTEEKLLARVALYSFHTVGGACSGFLQGQSVLCGLEMPNTALNTTYK